MGPGDAPHPALGNLGPGEAWRRALGPGEHARGGAPRACIAASACRVAYFATLDRTLYNNHYFLDPDTRRIITHKVRDGKTHCFQIQDFTRIVQP